MRVSVDVDDVVIEFTKGWQPIYENYFGIEVQGPVDSWDISNHTHFRQAGDFFVWWERIGGWSQIADLWVPGARAALDWITERDGWHLVFTTARKSELAVADALRLGGGRTPARSGQGIWPKAQVQTHKRYKADVAADIHIDDSPKIAAQFVEAGKPMILFDRPWNQDVETVPIDGFLYPGDIARAQGWNDILLWLELL